MKKLILLALVLFSAATMLAQTNRMSYQAVVRNAANELVAEENLTVAIRISDANSTSAFSETHSVTSNRNGVISLMIGEGSGQSGSMASVDWRTAQIHTVVTLSDGATLTNTTPVNAVPYAFYADSVDIHWVNDAVDDYLEHHSISSIVETDPTVPDWAKEATKPVYDYSEITNTPDMSGYLTSETDPTVPDWAKESVKPVYDYSEITNTPDMTPYLTTESDPTVNDGTLTITLPDGTSSTFTANQGGNTNVAIPAMSVADLLALVGGMTDAEKEALRDALGVTGGTAFTEPTVTTSDATDVTEASATLNGSISNPDNVAITAQGFEWKATAGGAYVAVNATGETMTYALTGLTAGTSYTYRAFVTTAAGTSYGGEVAFTTTASGSASFTCGTSKMVDADGNEYETVQIGTQCWTKTNLRSTKAADGSAIPAGGSTTSNTEPYYYDYSSHSLPLATRGYLYNWPAANEVCPAGWHLPSDAEWNTMEASVSGSDWQTSYETSTGYRGNHAGKLAGGDNWTSSTTSGAPGDYDNADRNVSGFSAVPAGSCHGSSFSYARSYAYFWSSTQLYSSNYAYYHFLYYNYASVNRNYNAKFNGYSVRCLRDETGGGTALTEPTVTTSDATDVTETSATLNGSVSNPDGVIITAQGFEWKSTTSGTYAQVTATGSTMSYVLTGLTAGTSYTYRAFVTTAAGTSYGDEVVFTTTSSAPTVFTCGTSKMVDADGNEYETVLIGTQCWTKTNLRSTKAADGSAIPAGGSTTSNTEPYYYDYSSHSLPLATRGYLYNWPAAQLVCPSGWHLPSDAEWTTMEQTQTSMDVTGSGWRGDHAGKLAGEGWEPSTTAGAPGNASDPDHNASGFSAVPAGGCYGSSFYDAGYYAYFWSATQHASYPNDAYRRNLSYNAAGVYWNNNGKGPGSSVRCLRD